MKEQGTLIKEIKYSGIGLHSGKNVTVNLKPAPVDTGIVFVRMDLKDKPNILAKASNVLDTVRSTTIGLEQCKISTIEHLMASFFALGIDNCYVETDGDEMPVADGSALVFTELLKKNQKSIKGSILKVKEIKSTLVVREEEKFVTVLPYDGFRITCISQNKHPLLKTQVFDFEFSEDTFLKEIAPARTVGFIHELKYMKEKGLAKGGSLDNVLVYDENCVLNKERFQDELVRHKVLDLIGDLFLAGRIKGHVVALKSSHALNTKLAKMIEGV